MTFSLNNIGKWDISLFLKHIQTNLCSKNVARSNNKQTEKKKLVQKTILYFYNVKRSPKNSFAIFWQLAGTCEEILFISNPIVILKRFILINTCPAEKK